jgi:hypothetical protein
MYKKCWLPLRNQNLNLKYMKAYFAIIIGLLSLCNLHAQTVPAVREQLEDLNKHWKAVPHCDPILEEKKQLITDVELIKTHLLLVENSLREKELNLTKTQSQNRSLCLDILKGYRERGVFPINLYHSERTPYFIDHKGTACAVG